MRIDDAAGADDQGVGPDDLAPERRRIDAAGHPQLSGLAEQAHPRLVHRVHQQDQRTGSKSGIASVTWSMSRDARIGELPVDWQPIDQMTDYKD